MARKIRPPKQITDEPHYVCSRCGREGIVDHANYCSYCGARVVDSQP